MVMTRFRSAALGVALLAMASGANAITYTVDRALGASGSVLGTVTTDGTLGVLNLSNFTAWDLLLNDGTATLALTESNSVVAIGDSGSATTATLTQLLFDYDIEGGLLFQQDFNTGENYWCNEGITTGGGFFCTPGESSRLLDVVSSAARSGSVEIGSAAIIPVPAALPLLLAGLGGLGLIAQRRRRTPLSMLSSGTVTDLS